ncbi:MAG: hypothetical protein ACLVJB_10845 [Christensenellales bacterium]
MAAKTVLNYLPRKSVVHELTGTTKLVFFLLFTFASMMTYDTRVLLALLLVSVGIFRLSKIRFSEVRFMMTFTLGSLCSTTVHLSVQSGSGHGALRYAARAFPPVLAV